MPTYIHTASKEGGEEGEERERFSPGANLAGSRPAGAREQYTPSKEGGEEGAKERDCCRARTWQVRGRPAREPGRLGARFARFANLKILSPDAGARTRTTKRDPFTGYGNLVQGYDLVRCSNSI